MKGKFISLLVLLSLCWGHSFLFIKIALRSFSPLQIVTLRTLIGAVFLFALLIIKKVELKKWIKYSKNFWMMSCLAIVLPWTFLSYAEKTTTSALAGIVNGTIPIFTMVLAHFFLDCDRFTKEKLIGLFFGFTGLFFIFLPTFLKGISIELLGLLFLFCNSFFSSCSIVFARKHLSAIPSIVAPFFQLFFGSITLLPLFFISNLEKPLAVPSLESALALIILGVIGTGVAFVIFYYLVKHAGATFTSTNSFLIPLVALLSGTVFLDEKVSIITLIGTGFIFVGLFMTNSFITVSNLKKLFKK